MTNRSGILSGLREIAHEYDALICDVWGVLHDGHRVRSAAIDALRRFRGSCGPVVLISNAPRPVSVLERQFERLGVPAECYDAIVTSGVVAREDLARRVHGGRLAILHIGPERDRGVFEGLAIDCVDAAVATVVLCTGPYHDDKETPDDYRDLLQFLKLRDLVLLCANPDIVVQRGDRLIYCAGAIARLYQQMGGEVVYYGKPHAPIYVATLAAASKAAGHAIKKPLAIGDGLETDIRGANAFGIDALFIADGVHGEEVAALTPETMAVFFADGGAHARAAMRTLVW